MSLWCRLCLTLIASIAVLAPVDLALAGGTPENAVIIIHPRRPGSVYIGHYYAAARNVPPENIIYLNPHPGPGVFDTFKDVKVPALNGALVNHGIEDHVDYLLLTPNKRYRFDAPGLVDDPCEQLGFPMDKFSQSSAFGLSPIVDEIAGGTLTALEDNRFFTDSFEARAFDSSVSWLNGAPSEAAQARRYFIGAMVGYDGDRGNTYQEITDMIDRSVAADATFPTGTIYFVETTDDARSAPRHHLYPGLVSEIISLGGSAAHLTPVPSTDLNVVADGNQDCVGIMTGWATPDILGADITLVPGAFCDHLTSYAATFGLVTQTVVSDWIRKGASASAGSVDEPCAIAGNPGKFPNPNLHSFYRQGSSAGEAWYRSTAWIPFHLAFYGDPLTRPFTHIPDVSVTIPPAPVSGTVMISPSATTTHPTAGIDQFELLINGISHGLVDDGDPFSVDTTALSDGHHDLRVLAYDDTPLRSVGRFIGTLDVDNEGLSVSLAVDGTSGDPATAFTFTVGAAGGTLSEIHLIGGSRVVASSVAPGTIVLFGRNFGPGPVTLRADAIFVDGRRARSAPVVVDVAYSEDPAPGSTAKAFDYTVRVRRDQPTLVALPAAHNHDVDDVSYVDQAVPTQAVVDDTEGYNYRLIYPDPNAMGTDTLGYRVATPSGNDDAVITFVYGGLLPNDDCSGATLVGEGSRPFTTFDATTDGPDETATCGNDVENDIWYRGFALCEGLITFTLSDLDYPATLAVYQSLGCPTGADAVACIQAPGETSVSVPVSLGTAFRVRIGGLNGAKGNGTLTIVCESCPADCAPDGGDGTVDTVDLLALLGGWGLPGQACDVTGDDVVDVQDLLVMLSGWGTCE